MATYEIYADTWERHHGKVVRVGGGIQCKLDVRSYVALYPYERKVITVHAVPTSAARRTKKYAQMCDDMNFPSGTWFTDVLESDVEVQADILSQLEG